MSTCTYAMAKLALACDKFENYIVHEFLRHLVYMHTQNAHPGQPTSTYWVSHEFVTYMIFEYASVTFPANLGLSIEGF